VKEKLEFAIDHQTSDVAVFVEVDELPDFRV
jgi:hypothetical protein